MTVIFMGVAVTAQSIRRAMDEFDSLYPDTNEYDQWLEKNTYKYAVEHNGRLYPCKHILSWATGIHTCEFCGGEQTNRVFRQLGFMVRRKRPSTTAGGSSIASVRRLRRRLSHATSKEA